MGKKRKADGKPFGAPREPKDEDARMVVNTFEDVADSEDEFHLNRDRILLDEPASKRRRQEEDEFLQSSDEEVLDYNEMSSDEEEQMDEPQAKADDDEEEEEEEEGWGTSRKDFYGNDEIETEEGFLQEAQEARRLQKKQLAAMTEADFGFDENEWMESKDVEKGASGKVVTEVLQLKITDSTTEEEKLKILHARYPEFEPIRQDYLRLQPLHAELKAAAEAAERLEKRRDAKSAKSAALRRQPPAVLKYWACASYLGAICMYFAILTSTAKEDGSPALAIDPTELHEHPVMESLLKARSMWERVESLPVNSVDGFSDVDVDGVSIIEEDEPVADPQTKLNEAIARKRLEKKRAKKSKSQLAAEAAQAETEARRAEKLRKTEQELAGLAALTDVRKTKKKAPKQPMLNLLNADDSDFGEETELSAHQAAEKAKKRKSLRFHASTITQKSNKRDAAGKDQGGDADIPHRERLKDRQERLQKEAEARGNKNKDKQPGAALGDDSDSDDNTAAPTRDPAMGDDDYYNLVQSRNKAKKADKAERAAAYAQAAKENAVVVEQEVVGADGKRKITYQIQKNKGLTPFRKKIVRNPRVKKKLKYESKMVKLRSQKAVYGGGEGRGGYQGEMTGIKTGLVRSVKL